LFFRSIVRLGSQGCSYNPELKKSELVCQPNSVVSGAAFFPAAPSNFSLSFIEL
jgi:hypothetical protein